MTGVLPRTGGRMRNLPRLVPGYLGHLTFRPHRSGLSGATSGRRWELAAYDLFLDLLLSGYAEITGRGARRGTAQLLILLNRIAFLVDDEFEHRVGRAPVTFDELAATGDIRHAILDMRTYLGRTCTPGQSDAIRTLLRRTVAVEYQRYANVVERRRAVPSVGDLLDDAAVDSGVVMRQLGQVIGLFRGDVAPPEVLADFHALGMACKLADDLRDWRHDRESGAGNVLLALLDAHPEENERVRLRMTEKRWQRLCADTFGEFARLYTTYYRRIRSRSLRIAADLMTETGRLGLQPSSGPTAARR